MENRNVYIALLDILGFKEFITNNSLDDVKEIFEAFIEEIQKAVNLESKMTGENYTAVNFNLFSDTIIFWTNDDSIKSFIQLNLVTSNILNYSMQIGLPLRGAISSGNILCDAFKIQSDKVNIINTILGTSLVNAYQLEKEQIWSGCIIDSKLEESENQEIKNWLSSKCLGKFFVRYNVPLKNVACRSMLTINWINLDNDVLSIEAIKESFAKFNKSTINKDVQIKIVNTISYYNYVKNIRKIK